jgi:hypothetical protein
LSKEEKCRKFPHLDLTGVSCSLCGSGKSLWELLCPALRSQVHKRLFLLNNAQRGHATTSMEIGFVIKLYFLFKSIFIKDQKCTADRKRTWNDLLVYFVSWRSSA